MKRELSGKPRPALEEIDLTVNSTAAELASAAERAGEVLANGGLMAFPAETVWGLAVSAAIPAAIERLRDLKGRQQGHPFPLYVASAEQAWQLNGKPNEVVARLAAAFWPGYLTIVLPLQQAEYECAAGPDGTVGVRVPPSSLLRQIVEATGTPLVQTSANPSGQPPLSTAEDVRRVLGDGIDLLLTTGGSPQGVPSTVVKPMEDGYLLLREGAITKKRLDDVLDVAPERTYR